MPPQLVVDASVVLKWFRKEETLSRQAEEFLSRHLDREIMLCAPDLLLYEVANVITRKPNPDDEQTETFLDDLRSFDLLIVPISWSLLSRSVTLVANLYSIPGLSALSIYDASYVALAEELGCPLVTADRRLVERLPRHPLVQLLA